MTLFANGLLPSIQIIFELLSWENPARGFSVRNLHGIPWRHEWFRQKDVPPSCAAYPTAIIVWPSWQNSTTAPVFHRSQNKVKRCPVLGCLHALDFCRLARPGYCGAWLCLLGLLRSGDQGNPWTLCLSCRRFCMRYAILSTSEWLLVRWKSMSGLCLNLEDPFDALRSPWRLRKYRGPILLRQFRLLFNSPSALFCLAYRCLYKPTSIRRIVPFFPCCDACPCCFVLSFSRVVSSCRSFHCRSFSCCCSHPYYPWWWFTVWIRSGSG